MIRKKTTKEILGESIQELALTKPVDKITVKEIVYTNMVNYLLTFAGVFANFRICFFNERINEKGSAGMQGPC